jgi:hypothetical protein
MKRSRKSADAPSGGPLPSTSKFCMQLLYHAVVFTNTNYRAWSLVTGKLPHLSQFGTTPPKPSIIRVSESSPWIPYTDQGIPAHRSAMQPSNVHSIFACFCDLSHLIHKGMYTLYSPTQRVKKQDLVRIYSSYLEWYGDLPDALRLGYNFTPAVLFVQ